MHCRACDVMLDEFEEVQKDEHGNFIDLCNHCLYFKIDDSSDAYNVSDTYDDTDK